MRTELEVLNSFHLRGVVSNERMLDKTRAHKTDRTTSAQGWPVGTNY
jgi:hypothetical protein